MNKNTENDFQQPEEDEVLEENDTVLDSVDEDVLQEETLEEEKDGVSDIEELQEEIRKLREDYLRAFADAENTKKRCAQEIEKNNKYAISSFAKALLSVADNLHRAIEAVSNDSGKENCEALLKGVELTETELTSVFGKFGITKMDIVGKPFDPNFHQVIQEVEDKSKPAGTVLAELQTGYMLNDRLLREAMVVVAK